MTDLYSVLASLLRYLFITVIYLFIFAVIRMIYLDIRRTSKDKRKPKYDTSYLEVISNINKLYFDVKQSYPLTEDVVIIGRNPDCTISIDDLYMSSQNTQLWFEDGEWYIADMGSTNGTYINGKKMGEEPLILDGGDKIRIGQVEFLIVIVGE